MIDLTPKEKETIDLMLKGLSAEQIAKITSKTVSGVKWIKANIFKKYKVKNTVELFAKLNKISSTPLLVSIDKKSIENLKNIINGKN